jgi:PAT family beta-lactamase induction signal transducer AmpG
MLIDAHRLEKRGYGFIKSVSIYWEKRLIIVFLMGFASGLPLALSSTTLQSWLNNAGVSLTVIGLFALVGTPYTLKFLWAPLIDSVPLPIISSLLGRRRAWMIIIQIALMCAIIAVALSRPETTPLITAISAFSVAFFSASQDIVIDAYRIEILDEDQQGAGAAMTQAGYRFGSISSTAGALYLAELGIDWSLVYVFMAGLVLVGFITAMCAPIPATDRIPKAAPGSWGSRFKRDIIFPFIEFFKRNRVHTALVILAFILLYKFGDAFLGVMAYPFYFQIGFTYGEVATASAIFGKFATLVGVFAGGLVVKRYGILKSLLIGGLLQMVSNLMYSIQAAIGPDFRFFFLTITIENVSGGMGSAAFVAYLSMLCNTAYTGTQYALFTSLMMLPRTGLSASSGWIADQLGWVAFFVFSALVALPGLLLLWWIIKRLPMELQMGPNRESS